MVFQIQRTNSNETTVYTGSYDSVEKAIEEFCKSYYYGTPFDITDENNSSYTPPRYYFKTTLAGNTISFKAVELEITF